MKKFLCSILLLFLLTQNHAYAEATPLPPEFQSIKKEAEERLVKEPIANCSDNLVISYDMEMLEFMKFLETNFQNKSATGSLVNIAISRFSEFKLKLQSLYLSLKPGGEGVSGTFSSDELNSYINCATIKDTYIDLGKAKMIEYIKNNQNQKRTIIMVEKYKAINNRLRDMNLQIAKMYGYFMTFKEKLPWFTKECIRI